MSQNCDKSLINNITKADFLFSFLLYSKLFIVQIHFKQYKQYFEYDLYAMIDNKFIFCYNLTFKNVGKQLFYDFNLSITKTL